MASPSYPFAAIIFDMDGVLVDTEAVYKEELRAFARHIGYPVAEDELNAQVGASTQDFRRLVFAWVRRTRPCRTPEEALAVFSAWSETVPPIDYAAICNPGVPETLAELKRRGVRLALASSSPLDNIREVLAACGIADAFEIIISGEQFRQSKPDPEIYLHALECLKLPAPVCCCVEDSVPGIAAGKAAGLTVIAKREERFGFSQAQADFIIDEIPDLLELRARP